MTTIRPAAYVRKSHRDAVSATAQLASIQELAIRQGVTAPLAVYADVGVSGRAGKRGVKSEWGRLRDDITAGSITVVYVTALDRAGRSLLEWLQFVELCVAKGVEVRDQSGVDRTSGDAEDIATIEMMMAQREGRKAVERSARGRATQARRGDDVYQGHPPYGWMRVKDANGRITQIANPAEPLQPLLEAIRATKGNVLAAARFLSTSGVPTRSGRPWDARVLTRALDRQGVIRARREGARRRRGPSDAPLSRIVVCHCGATMTPERDRRNGQWLGLVCSVGRKAGQASHGRYIARSRHVMELLKASMRVTTHHIERSSPTDTAAQRTDLEAKRRRLGMALADDAIGEDDYRVRMEAVKRDLAELDESVAGEGEWIGWTHGPLVDWTVDDVALGDRLRSLVRSVTLDTDMMPVAADYRVPWLPAGVSRSRRSTEEKPSHA